MDCTGQGYDVQTILPTAKEEQSYTLDKKKAFPPMNLAEDCDRT